MTPYLRTPPGGGIVEDDKGIRALNEVEMEGWLRDHVYIPNAFHVNQMPLRYVRAHSNKSRRRVLVWSCSRCGREHISRGWREGLDTLLRDCEAGEVLSMVASTYSWYKREIVRNAAYLTEVPTPLLPLALLCQTPDVSLDTPKDVLTAIHAICPTMVVELIARGSFNIFRRSVRGEPPAIQPSSRWKLIDSGIYGALISHPSYPMSFKWGSFDRFRMRSTCKVALLPDVSLEGVGYAIRVHPLVKTVEAARRYIYRLPRNAKFIKEV